MNRLNFIKSIKLKSIGLNAEVFYVRLDCLDALNLSSLGWLTMLKRFMLGTFSIFKHMKNLYTPSALLSEERFRKVEEAFAVTWSKDTTNADFLKDWSEKNKAYGQCAVTAVIIYDLYGGRMIYDKVNYHIWNELPDGTQQDFSREQFLDERKFSVYKYKTKEDILFDETGIRLKTEQKYDLLKKRFHKALKP